MARQFVLREGRTLTSLGGHGVARTLPHMHSTDAVWWSPRGNSYVAVWDPEGSVAYPRGYGNQYPYFIASINGIGEIRWTIELDKDFDLSCDQSARDAVAYFFEERVR